MCLKHPGTTELHVAEMDLINVIYNDKWDEDESAQVEIIRCWERYEKAYRARQQQEKQEQRQERAISERVLHAAQCCASNELIRRRNLEGAIKEALAMMNSDLDPISVTILENALSKKET